MVNKLVLIEWLDSHYYPDWHIDAPVSKPSSVRSVGWLIHDGEMTKVIAAHMTDEDPPHRNGEMTIPVCSIQSIRELS